MASSKLEEYKVVIIAIDFGTTFSGYAFASNDGKKTIYMNKNWGSAQGFQSYKTPTSVLVSDAGEIVDFGYESETKFLYNEDAQYLYRHFKMGLYRAIGDNRKIRTCKIKSTTGKQAPAVDIFAKGIKYLTDHAYDKVSEETSKKLDKSLIKWVLTVPAIWSDGAKHFMREAAKEAGLIDKTDSQDLIIALEPEAAAIYCRDDKAVTPEKGQRYLVIDCGGGTLDMTAHEVISETTMKEICPPSGGPWGGVNVDQNFYKLLDNIFGKAVMKDLKTDKSEAWLQLALRFELAKRIDVSSSADRDIRVDMPFALVNLAQNKHDKSISQIIRDYNHPGISLKNDSILSLSPEVSRGLYEGAISAIKEKLNEMLKHKELSALDYVFLVGGFSECVLVQNMVKEVFQSRRNCKVLVPSDGQLAIMKGAVLFAFQPMITSRIARFYYGFEVSREFDAEKHDPRYRTELGGKDWCAGLFSPVIKKGEVLNFDAVKQHCLGTNNESKFYGYTELWLYRSDEMTEYVQANTCQRVALLRIEHQFNMHEHNKIEIEIHCGSTELTFKAKDSGRNQWLEISANYC